MDYIFRLTKDTDLKDGIEQFCKENQINGGCVLSGVGCLYEAQIRLADGSSICKLSGRYEIVSLMGTISADGLHLHIALSDINGNTVGGHLVKGCKVNTTAEIVIHSLPSYQLNREYDPSTGYKELVIRKKEQ